MAKVLTDFSSNRYSDSELYLAAQVALLGLTGNPYFPEPTDPAHPLPPLTQPPAPAPPVLNLVDASATFFNALIEASNGGKNQTIAKNVARTILEDVLQQWATYVNLLSKGDITKLASSRFKLSKQPEPVGPLPKPQNFTVKATAIGRLELSVDSIKGASSYQWKLRRVDTDEPAIVTNTTAATITFNNLESTKQYECRVVAVGSDQSAKNWSDGVTSTVL